jgi:hypothetical protein
MSIYDGAYVTLQDVKDKLEHIVIGTVTLDINNNITAITPPTAKLNDMQVGKEIRAAEAKVIGRLSLKYILPFDPVINANAWAMLWSIALGFTCASLKYIVSSSGLKGTDPADDTKIMSNYGVAKKNLEDIMQNAIDLPDAVRIAPLSLNIQYSQPPVGSQVPTLNDYGGPFGSLPGVQVGNGNPAVQKGIRNY